VVAANVKALMHAKGNEHLNSNPKLGKKSGLGAGSISRVINGHNATLETLEALAKAFGLEPWQLLVEGWTPKNPPALQPISESEKRLYQQFRELRQRLQELES
jgi:transcriptional regulator with XRE-family HTH domain